VEDGIIPNRAVEDEDAVAIDALQLSERCRVIWLYCDDAFMLLEQASQPEPGDEVLLITHRDNNLQALRERWRTASKHADSRPVPTK
jgi:trk system potassium uptake protein